MKEHPFFQVLKTWGGCHMDQWDMDFEGSNLQTSRPFYCYQTMGNGYPGVKCYKSRVFYFACIWNILEL